MADRIKKIELNGTLYEVGFPIYDELGVSLAEYIERYGRDAYTPALPAAPTAETLTYTDTDGSTRNFRIGQPCVYPSSDISDGYGIAFLKAIVDGAAVWQDFGDILAQVASFYDADMNSDFNSDFAI